MHIQSIRKNPSHAVEGFFRFFASGVSVLHDAKPRVPCVRDAPLTQFVLRTDKKDKTRKCLMHLVVYFDGARLKCATGDKCKPADWNSDRQKFRASYPLPEETNQAAGTAGG